MALDKRTILKYRMTAESVGMWDENYSKIKRDLPSAIADIRGRDYALDVIGAAIKEMMLMARLLVYGYSTNDLSDDDIDALFAPLAPLSELENTPDILNNGAVKAVENIMPALFGVAHDCRDAKELERHMRRFMAIPAKISTIALAHGLGLSVCLRKFPGAYDEIYELNEYLDKVTADLPIKSDMITAAKARTQPGTQSYDVALFAAMFAGAVVDCNVEGGDERYNQMYELRRRIDAAAKRHHMYDYIHSAEFKLLLHGVEDFHEIG